jgi:uncharacterized protein (DUF433 family)
MNPIFLNFDRIVIDSAICTGKPHIKGTRMPVDSVLAYLGSGMTVEEFLAEFSWISRDDVLQALSFSSQMLNERYIPLRQAS